MNAPDAPERPHRRIRSFVLREGRLTGAQERALTELWPGYGIDYSPALIDLDTVFGRTADRLLEIGFGTGDALAAYAAAHPDVDCIGAEVHRSGVGHLLLKAHAENLRNLKVICHDAVEVLERQLPAGSLTAIHIFFPDPWPKKRHHKRRLIQPAFVERLLRALKPGGELRLATDWQPYAEHMLAVLQSFPELKNLAGETLYVDRHSERPITRFERRGQRLGHGVWDLAFRKDAST
ncbi:MAG: tRNA (guanosine(46)-N7)-methyltransferase TrmB [Steroidobacteraceae bacterium]